MTIARKTLLLAAAAAAALSAAGCAVPLVRSDFDQTAPAIGGSSSVVWEDSRDGETQGTDIYTSNVGSGTATLVVGGKGDQEQPAISSSFIVWIDGGKLRAMNRSTGTVFNVTSGASTQTDPALCGSVVAWTDSRNSSGIYARDLAGGPEIPVATSSAVEGYPACDAGRIVYMYAPTGEWASIRLYDIASGHTSVVSEQPWNEWRPAISGDRVVWQAWPNQPNTVDGIQIMGKNLSTGEDFTVTSGPDNQTAPTISGSVVAWEDFRSGVMRVWWRDLAATTGEQEVDPLQAGRQEAPALLGRRLAFQSDATGVWNVYTALLTNQ